ncbi:LLM class flavin-dependent oxidoreductase [Microbacterium sp. 4R-513]|uniref:LLM class flavin-dependent oxidoreductase n=1 Tax=Microbacterium sp. 4R-513 TaxID=2567934 RepID=UPI0013E0F70A|nr:LLM class flavin-dependent oxidoreductase [Microbacterium sp. 4R-513]QIG39564.1 LLM class flavin-dependent oxidoreductase [Microbacterium sp. 4R-513]
MTTNDKIRLGIALEGAGWHPSAWREPSSRPRELFSPAYWTDLVRLADRGHIDFATIEDSFGLQSSRPFEPDDRTDEVRGRLDALLLAARLAPVTERIGLIPTVTTTHTEPFHVSKAVATLDYASLGRAGWQPKVSGRADEARHVGRRDIPEIVDYNNDPAVQAVVAELFAEAADVVEVVRRLWDSWEDGAEIRDVATDRFLDADKLHTIDFASERFSIRGPSITPRPPQGQPVVAALAHAELPYRFAATSADLVFVTPLDVASAASILDQVRDAEASVAREGEPLRVYADIVVFLDGEEPAAARLARLDGLGRPLTSDTRIFTGSAGELAEEIEALAALGYSGVRLRPGVLTDDLPRIVEDLVPALRHREALAVEDAPVSLRTRLGLPTTVPNRYSPALAG